MNIQQPQFLYNIDRLRLSASTLNTFRSCPRKMEFRKFYKHASDPEENLPGDVGNALHRGYQSYLIHRDKDKAIYDMMMAYPIHLNSNPVNARSIEACYATLQLMMNTPAFLEYEIAQVKCLDGKTRPAVEVAFEIDIKNFSVSSYKNVPVTYVGFIDAILYDRMLNEYIVMDIKTTRYNLSDMTPVYMFDDQCIPYAIVLERVLGHAIDSLNIKYMSVYVDIKEPKTRIYPFVKGKDDIADWARSLYIDLQDMKRFSDLHWFKRNHNSCVSFNRTCAFFEICNKRDVQGIQRFLLMNDEAYVEKKIDPWIKMELELAA